jgi:hypothetical protein
LEEIGRHGKWTATGAARTARTARIDTAAYLRRAQVAHQWEIGKLVSGIDMVREHLRTQSREQAGSSSGQVPDAASVACSVESQGLAGAGGADATLATGPQGTATVDAVLVNGVDVAKGPTALRRTGRCPCDRDDLDPSTVELLSMDLSLMSVSTVHFCQLAQLRLHLRGLLTAATARSSDLNPRVRGSIPRGPTR